MSKIKICGLQSLDDVKIVNKYRPDYIGFVLTKSKREISFTKALELSSKLDPLIIKVGVFVQEDILLIKKYIDHKIIDIVQLHGDEDDDYYNEISIIINKPIIRVKRVKEQKDLVLFKGCLTLFDTYSKDSYGGTNLCFDHKLLSNVNNEYLIAGGLNIDNIDYLINDLNVKVIDVSSGVEKNGVKNENLIKEIIMKVRKSYE